MLPGNPKNREFAKNVLLPLFEKFDCQDMEETRRRWMEITSQARTELKVNQLVDPDTTLPNHSPVKTIRETVITLINQLYRSTNKEVLTMQWRNTTNSLFAP